MQARRETLGPPGDVCDALKHGMQHIVYPNLARRMSPGVCLATKVHLMENLIHSFRFTSPCATIDDFTIFDLFVFFKIPIMGWAVAVSPVAVAFAATRVVDATP
jgi:hypothetical protein